MSSQNMSNISKIIYHKTCFPKVCIQWNLVMIQLSDVNLSKLLFSPSIKRLMMTTVYFINM